ncbi:MAG: hypothetical protein AAGB06_02915 [Verrucomicrobiota bacterium]
MARSAARCFACLLAVSTVSAIRAEQAEESANLVFEPIDLEGDMILRALAFDLTYDMESPRAEAFDLFAEIVASPEFILTDKLLLHTELRMENITRAEEDRYFEALGFFVRQLYLKYKATDRLDVIAGKHSPTFAVASLIVPGMYGNSYNKDIELIERIGGGLEYTVDSGAYGTHIYKAYTFFKDISVLAKSLGEERTRIRNSDGGASNTESFDSFSFSIEGMNIARLPDLRYKLGTVYQSGGVGDPGDEKGVSLTVTQDYFLKNQSNVLLIGEVARMWEYEATLDDAFYATAAVFYNTASWTAGISGTYRYREDVDLGETYDDYSIQLMIKYNLTSDWFIEFAQEFNRDENLRGNQFGMRLVRLFDF